MVCRGESIDLNQDASIKQIMSKDLITADEKSSLPNMLQPIERSGILRVPIIHSGQGGKGVTQ